MSFSVRQGMVATAALALLMAAWRWQGPAALLWTVPLCGGAVGVACGEPALSLILGMLGGVISGVLWPFLIVDLSDPFFGGSAWVFAPLGALVGLVWGGFLGVVGAVSREAIVQRRQGPARSPQPPHPADVEDP